MTKPNSKPQARATLGSKISRRVENGHPWIYANEVADLEGEPEIGGLVEVYNAKNRFVGTGYINPNSQILIRLLSRDSREVIDDNFFRRRISTAWEFRKKIGYERNCRLIFSEADFLPGLIVDKFEDTLVLQTLTLGMDRWKETIVGILKEVVSVTSVYERNDVPVRNLEGMEQVTGFLSAPFPTQLVMEENGVKFQIDVENGQKTGFFLDQRENWLLLKKVVAGASVLDCFSYLGAFALHATAFGAREVLGLDISKNAVQAAQENAQRNGFDDRCRFEEVNVFDALNQWSKEGRKFDVIILDPPAFTKNRAGLQSAARGYKDINLRAMQLLNPGGFLLTCSCSRFMTPEIFRQVIEEAAFDAGKTLRQVGFGTQGQDHPILWNVEETYYLKAYLLQVV